MCRDHRSAPTFIHLTRASFPGRSNPIGHASMLRQRGEKLFSARPSIPSQNRCADPRASCDVSAGFKASVELNGIGFKGAMCYDASSQCMLLFGGAFMVGSGYRNDTWLWDGRDWTEAQ